MLKFLLLISVVLAVIWLMRASQRNSRGAEPPPPSPARPERMVLCAHCRLRFPESEAVTDPAGRLYCCDEHRQHGTG